ncbi:Quinone oxidoreductase 2 [compost metagenome]
MENDITSIQGVLAGAPWVTSAGNGKVGWALQQDFAEAAAVVLSGSGHDNTIYELSGKSLTQDEFAAAVGTVVGKEVPVQHVDDATYADMMKQAGVPDFVVPILVEIQRSIRVGSLDSESNDFEKLLGRPATPISEGIRQIVRQIS